MKTSEINIPTFETLIANLPADTQEYLRGEFARLTENGRNSFDRLFAIAYGHGAIDSADRAQVMIDARNVILKKFGL